MRRPTAAKICGLRRREDAEAVAAAGARYAGVVLAPGGKRTVSPGEAAATLAGLPLRRVGVFVDAPCEEVARAAAVARLEVIQLHGDEPPEAVQALRAGGWEVWKAIRPRGAADFRDAVELYAGVADGLLLDGWSAQAAGGTGSRFPWEEVAPLRYLVPEGILLIVAGGLDASNVARAISLLDPDVVDVSSGVERAPGVKDSAAVHAFVAAARGRPLPRANRTA